MRMFDMNKLPADVRLKVAAIVFADDLNEDAIGQAYLAHGWALDDGYSHVFSFSSRSELIDVLRDEVVRDPSFPGSDPFEEEEK